MNSKVILYSIIAHEYPESLKDMCENISYFTPYEHKIIVNVSPTIYDSVIKETKSMNNVFINPNAIFKKKMNSILWKSHVNNFNYSVNKLDLTFDLFIMMASNCLMIKPINLDKVKKIRLENIDKPKYIFKNNDNSTLNKWAHGEKLHKNIKLIKKFNELKIKILHHQHEGLIIEKYMFSIIIKFQQKHKLLSLIETELPFEEIIPVSLYVYLSGGFLNKCICKIFWRQNTIYLEQLNEFISYDNTYYFVKRVDRNPNDFIRKYIRKINNNYKLL